MKALLGLVVVPVVLVSVTMGLLFAAWGGLRLVFPTLEPIVAMIAVVGAAMTTMLLAIALMVSPPAKALTVEYENVKAQVLQRRGLASNGYRSEDDEWDDEVDDDEDDQDDEEDEPRGNRRTRRSAGRRDHDAARARWSK